MYHIDDVHHISLPLNSVALYPRFLLLAFLEGRKNTIEKGRKKKKRESETHPCHRSLSPSSIFVCMPRSKRHMQSHFISIQLENSIQSIKRGQVSGSDCPTRCHSHASPRHPPQSTSSPQWSSAPPSSRPPRWATHTQPASAPTGAGTPSAAAAVVVVDLLVG